MERTRYNFWIEARQREGLRAIKERDGISESEQIRRAINEWLDKRGAGSQSPTPHRKQRRR